MRSTKLQKVNEISLDGAVRILLGHIGLMDVDREMASGNIHTQDPR